MGDEDKPQVGVKSQVPADESYLRREALELSIKYCLAYPSTDTVKTADKFLKFLKGEITK